MGGRKPPAAKTELSMKSGRAKLSLCRLYVCTASLCAEKRTCILVVVSHLTVAIPPWAESVTSPPARALEAACGTAAVRIQTSARLLVVFHPEHVYPQALSCRSLACRVMSRIEAWARDPGASHGHGGPQQLSLQPWSRRHRLAARGAGSAPQYCLHITRPHSHRPGGCAGSTLSVPPHSAKVKVGQHS